MTQAQFTWSELMSQGFKNNPIPKLEELRTRDPFFKIGLPDGSWAWFLTRYDDVQFILKDPRFGKLPPREQREINPPESSQQLGPKELVLGHNMLNVDPPDHTRLRHLVSKAFTPRTIERLRSHVQEITDELLDKVQAQGHMELIHDFAFPLPITVICELLGVPVEDRERFHAWSNAFIEEAAPMQFSDQKTLDFEGYIGYLRALIAQKREHPEDDLISQLIEVHENDDSFSEMELLSTITLLIIAGHETTVNLIGNGVLALLQNPQQLQLLQEHPSYIETAVEELLRLTAPVTMTYRVVHQDVVLRDHPLRAGEMVMVSLHGADTDPEQFHYPKEMDITRADNKHMAFGKGIHFCLGAPLARLEGQIAIGTLLKRLPNLRLADPSQVFVWRPNNSLHGIYELPVVF